MTADVPLYRLYLLRAAYLLFGGGLILNIWPLIIGAGPEVPRMTGVAWSMFGALAILALIGLRYPLQMLPLLLFEIFWKAIWLTAYALPLWLSDKLSEAHIQTAFETALAAVLVLVMPWGHVWRNYVMRRGDRWAGKGVASPFRNGAG